MSMAIIVHGGAAEIEPERIKDKREGCEHAARTGYEVLRAGGTALEAVEAAVRYLEGAPAFNAGFGSMLNADGQARTDAGIMEGRSLQAGAVGAVQGVRHPISLARKLMDEPAVLLVGPYAHDFAQKHGLETCAPEALITFEQRAKWMEHNGGQEKKQLDKNTVGAIALDAQGELACGVSTGGTGNNLPGRVGDSACVGGGFYADNLAGAAVMTGDGENILRVALAKKAVDLQSEGTRPEEAAERCIAGMAARVGGEAGCILLNRDGDPGWAHNSPNMACAYQTAGMESPRAFVHKDEEQGRK